MLIMAFKPGHDGTVAVLRDSELVCSIEAEKDSFARYSPVTANALLAAAQFADGVPDVIALGGWSKQGSPELRPIGAGYSGTEHHERARIPFLGKQVEYFSSSHERSHIMMAVGMAPRRESRIHTVLVWEGITGAFYVLDDKYSVIDVVPVLDEPGSRYAMLFALADPTVPDQGARPRLNDSGKLMALAAYGDAANASPEIRRTVQTILTTPTVNPMPKALLRDSPVYNSGVESAATKDAAALLTDEIFSRFARVAEDRIPPGTPLYISGGCGLNCEWNERWRRHGHFSSVFVPPCTNDSGSAIGTAIDARFQLTGDPHVEWDVYAGMEFEHDSEPDADTWERTPLSLEALCDVIADGEIVAWVQGRWEMGPRALGNRSLLAEPFHEATRDRLNAVKRREGYRPIAPVCRAEDVGKAFDQDFEDPHMLYFRRVTDPRLRAVTHVDGSARVQTVRHDQNHRLHALLSAYADVSGLGLLCNTSLNFSGRGFINRMSDLAAYCERTGLNHMAVGDTWYRRRANGQIRA